jgi:hypothetical protein
MKKYANVLAAVTVFFLSGMVSDAAAQANSINLNAPNEINLNTSGFNVNADIIRLNTHTAQTNLLRIDLNTNHINLGISTSPYVTTTNYGRLFMRGPSGIGAGHHSGEFSANRGTVYNNLTAATYNGVVKHFIHPHPTDESTLIRYTSMESGEALTVVRGLARTENGQVTISLPEHFALVTSNAEPISVILTPDGAPVLLYTKERSREKIVVAMKPSDFSEYRDVLFSYQVTGTRDGFEKLDILIAEEKLDEVPTTADFEKNEVQKRIKAMMDRKAARNEAVLEKKE